jgi:ABC-type antimicrobial peptide transport system permease subunit
MALGARPAEVLRLFLGKGLILAGLGVVLGVTLSIALTRFLQALLPGISATDPVTFVSVSALALMISALAAFIPARRATRIAPVTALRYQ